MKNRHKVWITRGGQYITLADMETSHLTNTAMYLQSRLDLFYRTFGDRINEGALIPEPTINGASYQSWIDSIIKELERRSAKAIKEAQDTLDAYGM